MNCTTETLTPYLPAVYLGTSERTDLKWHYTTGECFSKAFRDGYLRPAYASTFRKHEKAVVWFSSNPVFEATACKGLVNLATGKSRFLTFAEHVAYPDGLMRIGVAAGTAPLNFRAIVHYTGMARRCARHLTQVAYEMGANPADWWGATQTVPRSHWLTIERWTIDHWEPLGMPEERETWKNN